MKRKVKRFKNTGEMLNFIKDIRKRTNKSLQLLKKENKDYDQLLKIEITQLREAEAKYKSKKK